MGLSVSAYRTLFDDDPDGLVVLDPATGVVRECNRRYGELHGRAPADLVGRALPELTADEGSDESGPDLPERLRSAVADGETISCWIDGGGGTTVPVEMRPSTVAVDGESLVLARVTKRDPAVERKARAMDDAPIGVSLSDPSREDNPLVYVNDRFERLTGYTADDVVGRNCRMLQGAETAAEPVAALGRAIEEAESVTVELRNYRKDGTPFWNRVTVAPVRRDDGTVVNFVGFQEDITERKRYERELELSHRLLETLPSGVFRTAPAPDGTFEYANPALVSLLGAESAEQLRNCRVAEFYANPDVRAELVEELREGDADHVRRELTLETLDGERRDVIVTASLSEDGSGTEHVHKVVQDITERKERERALERYERLVEDLPIGVYQNTPVPDDEFTVVNDAIVEMFDADSREALQNTPVRELYADPDERAAFAERLVEQGVVVDRELKLETLTGEERWGAVSAIAREVDGDVVFDGVIQDITRQKRYERRLKEQRDNLDTLNQMVRHDIRNDLQLVTAYAGILSEHVDEEAMEYLDTIRESAAHAVELTQTARDMADVMLTADDEQQSVDLRTVLDREVDRIRSKHADSAAITADSVPAVTVVANDLLGSVFRNLLSNAIRHNDTEVPDVCVTTVERDDSVIVRIADNGPGVPDDRKEAIFGRGEKGLESEGTGIGLYLVETLVESYGGEVWIEDNEPRGAVFVVELPTAD